MKLTLLYLFFLFTSISCLAQQPEITNLEPRKFYVGVDLNVTPYYLKYYSQQTGPLLGGKFTPYPGIHVGYQVSKRVQLQIGAAYAANRLTSGGTYNNNGVMEGSDDVIKTKGFVVPVSLRYNFLNVAKRFQGYGFATVTTALGQYSLKSTNTRDDIILSGSKENKAAVGLFMGLGVGVSYRLNNRFTVFGEYAIINRNLSGGYEPNPGSKYNNSLNMGLNYKL